MAISTIKYDENEKPKRVKWIIVSLGNLNPHEWTNTEFYAPLMSITEVIIVVALSIHHKHPLRYSDLNQDLVMDTLIDNEKYVV